MKILHLFTSTQASSSVTYEMDDVHELRSFLTGKYVSVQLGCINYDIVCSSCNNGQKWSDKPISAEACKFGEGLTLTMWHPRPFNRHEIWPNALSGHFAHVAYVVTCPILIMVSQLYHWIQADYASSYWRVFSLVQSLMFTPPSLSSTLSQTARSRFNCKISDQNETLLYLEWSAWKVILKQPFCYASVFKSNQFFLASPSLPFSSLPLPLSALCRCGKTSQLSDRRFGRLTDEQPCGHHMTWDEVTWEIATTKWWWRQSVTEEVFNIFSRGRWMKVSSRQSYCLRQSEDLQDDIFRCFMVLFPSCPCRQQDGSMNTYNITTPILKCLLIK